MLTYREHLMFLILKQYLFLAHYFIIEQTFIVINIRLLVTPHFFAPLQTLVFQFCLFTFLYSYIVAISITNSVMIFQPSLSFITLITFIFVSADSNPLSSFQYRLVSNLVSDIFCNVLVKILPLSHTQSCLCPYRIVLPYFHTWAACSHSGTHTLTSCLSKVHWLINLDLSSSHFYIK